MGFNLGSILRFAAPIAGLALGGPVGGAAGSLLAGAFKKKQQPGAPGAPTQDPSGRVSSPQLSQYDADFQRRLDAEGGIGDRFSSAYETGMSGFDPQEYLRQATAGAAAGINEQSGFNRLAQRQANNASGFLNSGAGQGRLMRDQNQRIATASNNLAFQAAGLQQNKLSEMGAYGARSRDTALEGSFDRYATERGSLEEERNRRQMEQANKRSTWGSIGGAALGAAGSVLGAYLGRK